MIINSTLLIIIWFYQSSDSVKVNMELILRQIEAVTNKIN